MARPSGATNFNASSLAMTERSGASGTGHAPPSVLTLASGEPPSGDCVTASLLAAASLLVVASLPTEPSPAEGRGSLLPQAMAARLRLARAAIAVQLIRPSRPSGMEDLRLQTCYWRANTTYLVLDVPLTATQRRCDPSTRNDSPCVCPDGTVRSGEETPMAARPLVVVNFC